MYCTTLCARNHSMKDFFFSLSLSLSIPIVVDFACSRMSYVRAQCAAATRRLRARVVLPV